MHDHHLSGYRARELVPDRTRRMQASASVPASKAKYRPDVATCRRPMFSAVSIWVKQVRRGLTRDHGSVSGGSRV